MGGQGNSIFIPETIRGNYTNKKNTIEGAENDAKAWPAKLDIEFGKRIGRIERISYIYAFMLGQFSLLSAWVILKAFYGWIQKPDVAQSGAPESEKEITTFYSYVPTTFLSRSDCSVRSILRCCRVSNV
jgi:hypothetical protein